MPKADKPTDIQIKALRLVHARGGLLVRRSGGFWIEPETRARRPPPRYLCYSIVPTQFIGTNTVRALESMGLLERTHQFEEEWKDTRRLTKKGLEALHGKTRTRK